MKKIITVIVLIFAITICGACGSTQGIDDLKSQTSALEQLITSQQGLIEELKSKLNDNNQNSALLQGKIDELKKKNEELENKLGESDQNSISMKEEIDELKKQNDLYKAQLRNLMGAPVEFTAKNPRYGEHKDADKSVRFDTPGSAYKDFSDYFNENYPYGEKNVLILKHKDNDNVEIYNEYYEVTTKDGETQVMQYIKFYDEIFGSYYKDEYAPPDPGDWKIISSLSLQFFWAPTFFDGFEPENPFFRIEFGSYNAKSEYGDFEYNVKYFNIYYSLDCVGTCYYYTDCYISHNGIQDYLINRLIGFKGAEE